MLLVKMKHGHVDSLELNQIQLTMDLLKIFSENLRVLDTSVLCEQPFSNFLMEFLETCNERKHQNLTFGPKVTSEKRSGRTKTKVQEASLFPLNSEIGKQRSYAQEIPLKNNPKGTSETLYDIEKETRLMLNNLLLQIEDLIQRVQHVPTLAN